MSSHEASQILQRLNSLKIVETPKEKTELGKRECYSLDSKKFLMVPATPSTGGMGKFQTELKKRRKNKVNRIYTYEADQHFIKARKSLNF